MKVGYPKRHLGHFTRFLDICLTPYRLQSASSALYYKNKEKEMSWNLNQKQYAEFIRIWQSSNTSNEALSRLKGSDIFPSTFAAKSGYYHGTKREITLPYIQGIARAFRDSWGVAKIPLKCLRSSRTLEVQTASDHLDFTCLKALAEKSLLDT